jgi:hypothetical protein
MDCGSHGDFLSLLLLSDVKNALPMFPKEKKVLLTSYIIHFVKTNSLFLELQVSNVSKLHWNFLQRAVLPHA